MLLPSPPTRHKCRADYRLKPKTGVNARPPCPSPEQKWSARNVRFPQHQPLSSPVPPYDFSGKQRSSFRPNPNGNSTPKVQQSTTAFVQPSMALSTSSAICNVITSCVPIRVLYPQSTSPASPFSSLGPAGSSAARAWPKGPRSPGNRSARHLPSWPANRWRSNRRQDRDRRWVSAGPPNCRAARPHGKRPGCVSGDGAQPRLAGRRSDGLQIAEHLFICLESTESNK